MQQQSNLFRLRVFHSLHLQLSRTSNVMTIRDFHLYFIVITPHRGMVVERLPSA
nr:MAG TPA: hypothetical protein [Caudoviricetes sp.]